MKAYPDEFNPPFNNIPSSMADRHLRELFAQLASEGISVTGETEDGALQIDLSQLAVRAGTRERAKANLYAALSGLNIARIDLSPSDVTSIMGLDGLWLGVARGLESSVPSIVRLLRELTPDELFSNLDAAASFVMSDNTDESTEQGRWLASQLRQAAAADMKAAGLLEGDTSESYRRFLEPEPEPEVPELPEEYRDHSVKPYFNDGGY